ncbi:MAG: F0F1 ATP synthase subunit gamma [Acidimicrobiia bacterium]
MASAELRQIKRRIRSVQSTRKITRAMELIAASRIVRAQARVQAAGPYVTKLAEVIQNAARAAGGTTHMLLEARDVETVGLVVVTSDRGLAGAYNANIYRLAERTLVEHRQAGRDYRLYAVGKKAQSYFRFRGYAVQQSFLGVTDTPGYGDARAVANTVLNEFASGAVDKIEVVYTRFLSALAQEPLLVTLIPVEPPEAEEGAATVAYEYEPDAETLLARLLPRFVEATVFGALLTSSASEHASRQRAMKAATENADELIKLLDRVYNQARQAEITTEISEIVGGAEALIRG